MDTIHPTGILVFQCQGEDVLLVLCSHTSVLWFLKNTSNVLVMINWSVFVTTILIRLMTYYYYANELMLQSSNIGNAIWESKWYEEPQKVKQMMIIMIMRSNKALALVIGPFTTMTLSTFQGTTVLHTKYELISHSQKR
ncbi:hypothetical protein NQ318_009541 [Aromia moschata]|uniref:Uncharacterized protein n=1 Tax=Aromia moschata TaxID=1265417 RepID=A0AAV8Y9I4_9CUCU|nr:hypothetical protein NQ318_009541 [Aromia moschata]